MSGYIDFAELKAKVSLEDVAQRLGLKVSKSGNQLRAPCPICKTGGDRALAITPAKSLFYCFADQKGGDQIQLVAHIKALDNRAAAEWLGGTVTSTSTVLVQNSTVSKAAARFSGDRQKVATPFEPSICARVRASRNVQIVCASGTTSAQAQVEEAHERQPVLAQILGPHDRQPMRRLQD